MVTRISDRLRRRSGDERGATLVEFAIVAPLLFLLLFGVIEFARLITTFVSVSTASREGARYATAVGPDAAFGNVPRYINCAGIENAVQAKIPAVAVGSGDITIEWDDGPGGTVVADCQGGTAPTISNIQSGHRVVVTVERTFNAVAPIISIFLDGIDVESTDARTIFKGVLSG